MKPACFLKIAVFLLFITVILVEFVVLGSVRTFENEKRERHICESRFCFTKKVNVMMLLCVSYILNTLTKCQWRPCRGMAVTQEGTISFHAITPSQANNCAARKRLSLIHFIEKIAQITCIDY